MTFKIKLLSDTHLEIAESERLDTSTFLLKEEGITILAGDICSSLSQLPRLTDQKVIMILGNHEYYGKRFSTCLQTFLQELEDLQREGLFLNFSILNNESVTMEKEKIRFICSTMWSDLSDPFNAWLWNTRLNDKRYIGGLSSEIYLQEFNQSVDFIKEELSDKSIKKVKNIVVTHHAPSFHSIHPDYRAGSLSSSFASNLEDLILDYKPLMWLHGHTHYVVDYSIGKTRVISNPRGYRHERLGYKEEMIIELNR